MIIQETFASVLSKFPYWEPLKNSVFVQSLVVLIDQIINRVSQVVGREVQEARLSTAIRRGSILASASDRNYVPRKNSAPFGLCRIDNQTNTEVNLPRGTALVSGEGLACLLEGSVTVPAGGNVSNLPIKQLSTASITQTVAHTTPYFEMIIPRGDSAKLESIAVKVQHAADGNEHDYQFAYMLRRTHSESLAYTEFYTPTEQYGVRFGNGVNGRALSAGDVVTVSYNTTEQDSFVNAGEKITFNDEDFEGVEITVTEAISRGLPQESIEEIRTGALYSITFNGEVVWSRDYQFYLKNRVAGIDWINVWGEAEQERQDGVMNIANINTVFISAYSATLGPSLTQMIRNELALLPEFSAKYKFIETELVEYRVTAELRVPTTVDKGRLRATVLSEFSRQFGKNRKNKHDTLKEKDFWRFMDKLTELSDHSINVVGPSSALKLNQFAFAALADSDLSIKYEYES